jgi:membrane protease YdiL (CAAX protease family)
MYPDPELGPTPPLPAQPAQPPGRPLLNRAVAALEVLICSDYPTQFALATTFAALGYRPLGADGHLLVGYVVALSLLDTALLVGLILFFLHAHGERPRDVILGSRPIWHEAAAGIPLIFIAIGIATGVLLLVQRVAPSLHTVEHNPFQDLIRTPGDAVIFGVIVVVAGGIREEVQRAFLLHRFEVWLGGGAAGIAITSVAFGAGHFQLQGADAAIATALLGALWGVVYLRRRSAVAPIVSHSGFNLLQIVQYFIIGS